jgi:hypothetical protein
MNNVTTYKPEGVRTLDVYWNHGILRLTQDADLCISEDRGVVTYFVYEPVLDEEFVLAEITLDVKTSEMDESQYGAFFWLIQEYEEGIAITKTTQLEDTFHKMLEHFRKLGLIK